jgi:hypothetical protein
MAGQPITLTIPAVGTAGTTYASQINTAFGVIETELERKVVPADMNINANLSFLSGGVNYAATDLKYSKFALQSEATITAAGFPMTLFVGSSDGELYFNDNSGRQIQLTTDGTVNVSTSGGINSSGSAYGTSGVEVLWDSGDGEYEMKSGSGTSFADVRLDDVVFYDGSSNYLRMTAGSMASDFTLTLPTALPASTSILLVDNTGAMSSTRDPSVATVTTSGNASFGGTTTSTGLITASAGVTASANQHITVSGTGKFKHGSRKMMIPGLAFQTGTYPQSLGGESSHTVITECPVVGLPSGVNITSVVWYFDVTGGDTVTLKTHSRIMGNADSVEATNNVVDADSPLTQAVNITLTDTMIVYLRATSVDTTLVIAGVQITYNQP